MVEEKVIAGVIFVAFIVGALAFLAGLTMADALWKHRTRARELEHAERMEAMRLRAARDAKLLETPPTYRIGTDA
jgi:hypothetical protein